MFPELSPKLFLGLAIALKVWLMSSQLDILNSSVYAQAKPNSEPASNSEILKIIETRDRLFLGDWRSPFKTVQELKIASEEVVNESDRPLLLATPSQFDPSLRKTDPAPAPVPELNTPPKIEPQFTDYALLDNLKLNFQNSADNGGQRNQIIEPTWQWRFKDGSIVSFQTGFNSFDVASKPSVRNIPLQLGLKTKLGTLTLETRAGIDLYDRLPTTVNFDINASIPILSGLTLFGFLEQKPYKFSAESLNNQISTRRFGPNIYWQIDPDTSLFSLYRWGNYNDGNNEQQSFSRIERKLGQFAVAGNLFIWFYDREAVNNTYFAPPDFLVYSGEISWEGDIFNRFKCRLAASLGEQRLNSTFSPAQGYQARCTVNLSANIDADFGYNYSNIRSNNATVNNFINETVSGQVRVKF